MKKKILLILALSLGLSACSKEEYISQRHPEENKQSSPVSAKIDFKEKESNDNASNASLKTVEKKEDNKKDTKENKENNNTTENKNTQENPQEAYGIFTVGDISNIRREMNTDSEIVATIQPGTQIERTEIVGEWSKVSYGEYEGYILTELLEDVQ